MLTYCIDHGVIANAFNDYFVNTDENNVKEIMSTNRTIVSYMSSEVRLPAS